MRGWIGRGVASRRRKYLVRLGEEREAGAARWEQLLARREDEELLNGAKSGDLNEGLELHKVRRDRRRGDRHSTVDLVAHLEDSIPASSARSHVSTFRLNDRDPEPPLPRGQRCSPFLLGTKTIFSIPVEILTLH